MTEPKNGSISARLMRVTALSRASEIVGPAVMAEALGIQPRSLRAKLSVDRGVTDDDLRIATATLFKHADSAVDLAGKMRDLLA